jgi:hypothetical protein
MDKPQKKDMAHTIYRNQAGIRVPGTSTICGVMDKPALVGWANRIGLEGIEVRKYVDALAEAGTLAHYLVECDLRGEKPNQEYLDEFSKVTMTRAKNSLMSYSTWKKKHSIEVIAVELKLVSEELQFGGQLDSILKIDGVVTLTDIKTCKALYGPADEKWTQCAGYDLLAEEHGYKIDEVRILRIGREESEGFEFPLTPNRELHRDRFRTCRQLYELNKILKRKAA